MEKGLFRSPTSQGKLDCSVRDQTDTGSAVLLNKRDRACGFNGGCWLCKTMLPGAEGQCWYKPEDHKFDTLFTNTVNAINHITCGRTNRSKVTG